MHRRARLDVRSNIYWILVVPCLFIGFGCESATDEQQEEELPTSAESTQAPLQGGNILTKVEGLRSGVVEISRAFRSNATKPQTCTGTVLFTSAFERRSWVLTAAQCICNTVGPVSVRRPEGLEIGSGGEVFSNPAYRCGTGDSTHDLALISLPFAIPMANNVGAPLEESFRPIWIASPLAGQDVPLGVFGAGIVSGYSKDPSCVPDTQSDDKTLRWAQSQFRDGPASNIATVAPLTPVNSYLGNGDTGGPWMTRSNNSNLSSVLNDGVVAGVTSSMRCLNGSYTYEAPGTWERQNKAFLSDVMGSDLVGVENNSWVRSCWSNWCRYSNNQKTALLVSARVI